METTGKADPEAGKTMEVAAPPPPPPSRGNFDYFPAFDVGLRVFLFAVTLAALVVMVTAEQTEFGRPAKFRYSPAFVYLVAALSVACLYSIISSLISISLLQQPDYALKFLLPLIFCDMLMLGIVAAATGASGGVAYIGLKGNGHVQWVKICNVYDKYCRHLGSSIALSLVASVVLLLLAMGSVCSLHRRLSC